MIKVGIVSTADAAAGSVRVTFPDRDSAVSGDLPVITSAGWARGLAVPKPGEMVLCAMLSGSAGFCLGTYFGAEEAPPGNADQRGVWFEDGSFVYYDRTSKSLHIKATGGARIEGNVTVTGTLTAAALQQGGGGA